MTAVLAILLVLFSSSLAFGQVDDAKQAIEKGEFVRAVNILSDALAQWALRRHETRQPPWAELLGLFRLPESDFGQWVEALWEKKELRNDDVSVLTVEIPAREGKA